MLKKIHTEEMILYILTVVLLGGSQGGLYKMLAGKRYKEYVGVYYQEELQGDVGTAEVNKTEKRVITYVAE